MNIGHFVAIAVYITKWHGTSTGTHFVNMSCRAAFHGRPRDLHGSAFVNSKHFIATVAYVTKWHGTSTGGYFVNMSFEKEIHERSRGLDGSSVCDF